MKLWRTIFASGHLNKLISEDLKLAEIRSVLVFGLMEDEKCISSIKFLKSCHGTG